MNDRQIKSVELSTMRLHTMVCERFDLWTSGNTRVDMLISAVQLVQDQVKDHKTMEGNELSFRSFQKLEYAIKRLRIAVDDGVKKKELEDSVADAFGAKKKKAKIGPPPEVRGPEVVHVMGMMIHRLEDLLMKEYQDRATPISVIALSQSIISKLGNLYHVSEKIGGQVFKSTHLIWEALNRQKDILLELATHERRDVYYRFRLCEPLDAVLVEARKAELSFSSSIHWKVVSECLSAIQWIDWSAIWKPLQIFDNGWNMAEAYCEQVIEKFKNKDERHVIWAARLKDLYTTLRKIILNHYDATLPWTPSRITPSSPPKNELSMKSHNDVVWSLDNDTTTKIFCLLKDTKTVLCLAATCKKLHSFISRAELFKKIRLQIGAHRLKNEVVEGLFRLSGNGPESFVMEVLPYPWHSRKILPKWLPGVFQPAQMRGIGILLPSIANLTSLELVKRFRSTLTERMDIFSSWHNKISPNISRHFSTTSFVQEFVSPLLHILSPPTLRPVTRHLLSEKEKSEMAELVDTMVSYSITYRTMKFDPMHPIFGHQESMDPSQLSLDPPKSHQRIYKLQGIQFMLLCPCLSSITTFAT